MGTHLHHQMSKQSVTSSWSILQTWLGGVIRIVNGKVYGVQVHTGEV